MSINRLFGRFIHGKRKILKLTQDELCRTAKIGTSTLNRVEWLGKNLKFNTALQLLDGVKSNLTEFDKYYRENRNA